MSTVTSTVTSTGELPPRLQRPILPARRPFRLSGRQAGNLLFYLAIAFFLVNLVAGLIAYTYQPKKPSLHIRMPQNASSSLVVL